MKLIPFAAMLGAGMVLAGCAHAPAPATQLIDVPVQAPCLQAAQPRPDYEFDKMAITDSDGDKVLALARDWVLGRKYEAQLEASLAGCLPAQP